MRTTDTTDLRNQQEALEKHFNSLKENKPSISTQLDNNKNYILACRAAELGYLEALRKLQDDMNLGSEVDPDSAQKSPLRLAIENDKLGCVQFILDNQNTDLNFPSGEDSKTALMVAAENGKIELVQRFLREKTPTTEAIKKEKEEEEEEEEDIIVDNTSILILDRTDHSGNTAAKLAEINGHHDIVALLKKQQADLEPSDTNSLSHEEKGDDNWRSDDDIDDGYNADTEEEVEDADTANEALIQAIIAGNLNHVEQAIRNGADVNHKSGCKNNTPLMIAASQKNPNTKIVKALIDAKAELDATDTNGETALMTAARQGHTEVVEQLLNAEAVPSIKDKAGYTALHLAAREGKNGAIEVLLNKGADINATTINEEHTGTHREHHMQETPLMLAAYHSQHETVELLCDNDADTTLKNKKGETAYDMTHHSATQRVIKTTQADQLIRAAKEGNLKDVEALIDQGVEVDSKDPEDYTALRQAADNGYLEVVQALVSAGANCNQTDEYGDTALIRAAYQGHTDVVQYLLKADASLESKNEFDNTALIVAAWKGHTEVVKALVKAGADVSAKNKYGATALLAAAQNGHTEVVDYLVENKANPEAANSEGYTALMLAAEKGHTKAISHMLNTHQLDTKTKNKQGKTATDISCASDIKEITSNPRNHNVSAQTLILHRKSLRKANDRPAISPKERASKLSEADVTGIVEDPPRP